MCRRKWMLMLFLGLLHSTRFIRGGPTLTITPAQRNTSATLTVTCNLAGVTTTGLTFSKDSSVLYPCILIGLTCGHSASTSDYSDVDWSQTDKAIFTISNVTKARDNGEWTCKGDSGGASSPVNVSITDAVCLSWTIVNGNFDATGTTYGSTANASCNTGFMLYGNPTTTCQADGTWSGSIPSCKVNATTPTPTIKTTQSSVFAGISPTTYAITSPIGLPETTIHTTYNTEKLTIGLIAGGVGFVVVICCSMCICAIMRRKVNKKKADVRQERRTALEANVQISESL